MVENSGEMRNTLVTSYILNLNWFDLNVTQAFALLIVFSVNSPTQHVLDASKLKEFADDNFKRIENGIKFSKRVENAVGKGEIARYEQFLLFPQCFQKTRTADA